MFIYFDSFFLQRLFFTLYVPQMDLVQMYNVTKTTGSKIYLWNAIWRSNTQR